MYLQWNISSLIRRCLLPHLIVRSEAGAHGCTKFAGAGSEGFGGRGRTLKSWRV